MVTFRRSVAGCATPAQISASLHGENMEIMTLERF